MIHSHILLLGTLQRPKEFRTTCCTLCMVSSSRTGWNTIWISSWGMKQLLKQGKKQRLHSRELRYPKYEKRQLIIFMKVSQDWICMDTDMGKKNFPAVCAMVNIWSWKTRSGHVQTGKSTWDQSCFQVLMFYDFVVALRCHSVKHFHHLFVVHLPSL